MISLTMTVIVLPIFQIYISTYQHKTNMPKLPLVAISHAGRDRLDFRWDK